MKKATVKVILNLMHTPVMDEYMSSAPSNKFNGKKPILQTVMDAFEDSDLYVLTLEQILPFTNYENKNDLRAWLSTKTKYFKKIKTNEYMLIKDIN